MVNEFQKKWECLKRESFDDLLQECLTHWFFTKSEYDSTRKVSLKAFMGRIIRNKLTDLVREREREKRSPFFHSISLDNLLAHNKDIPIEKIKEDRDNPSNILLNAELRSKISKAFQKLNPQQKNLCRLLMEKGLTIKEISASLNIHRSTLYEELKRIRAIFKKAGLEDYLK